MSAGRELRCPNECPVQALLDARTSASPAATQVPGAGVFPVGQDQRIMEHEVVEALGRYLVLAQNNPLGGLHKGVPAVRSKTIWAAAALTGERGAEKGDRTLRGPGQ